MAREETPNHLALKSLALAWAAEQGMSLGAPEVSFPHRKFRVDAAACLLEREVPARKPSTALTSVLKIAAVFECKQVRCDLIRDTKKKEALTQRLKNLEHRRKGLEDLLKIHYPHYANGESLFREFDSYRLDECQHQGYRKLVQHISAAKRAIIKGTKFDRLFSYRLANLHYLVVEDKLLKSHEVPNGWGLLVRRGEVLSLVEQPAWQEINVEEQLVFLQRIASCGWRLRVLTTNSPAESYPSSHSTRMQWGSDRSVSKPIFLFAPGAGAPSSHPWMQRWANALGEIGTIEMLDYPYMLAHRNRPDPLPQLISAHRFALDRVRAKH